MSEPPRRATLTLRSSPVAKAPVMRWKCKPCGVVFDVAAELADDDAVRCAACNAKLGRAAQFRADPPDTRVRARLVEAVEPPAPKPPPGPIKVIVQRRRLAPR